MYSRHKYPGMSVAAIDLVAADTMLFASEEIVKLDATVSVEEFDGVQNADGNDFFKVDFE